MPTNPPRRLFDPESAQSQAQSSISASVSLLAEVRNYGLSVLVDCANRSNKQQHDVAILMLYRHLLEVLDGFSILVAAMAPLPAEFQLRSLIEALFSIKYITREDSARRALSYLVVSYHVEARKMLAALDPTTPQNKTFVSKFRRDEILSGVQVPELADAEQDREAVDVILNTPPLKEIHDEYLRVKTQRNRNPNWYELFQGPGNMEQLARTVDMSGLYQQIYRNTSESLHCGRTIREGLVRTSTGGLVLSPLRNFARLPDAALTGGGLGFIGIEAVIDYWMPPRTKELGEWYRREVRPLMNRLEELKRQVG